MTETKDIPPGTYTLELGSTFNDDRRRDTTAYHALRYDFKPQSVTSSESDTYIALGGNGDVHVAVPTEGENMMVFKGSKKEAKPKECLLFLDKKTGKLRLEKISSNINVKQTRDLEPGMESTLRNKMSKLRATKKAKVALPTLPEPSASFPRGDSSSSSSSSDDSDSDSGSDDEAKKKKSADSDSCMSDMEVDLLNRMKSSPSASKPTVAAPALTTSSSTGRGDFGNLSSMEPPMPAPTSQSSHKPPAHKAKRTESSDPFGLHLSESSDDD